MKQRAAKAGADGIARPALDVFGNAYEVATTRRGIGDGYYVVIPAGASAELVEAAIVEIKADLGTGKKTAVKKAAPKRKAKKDEN